MFALLLTVLIVDGILLIVVVLLQAGKGGGLAAMGGGAAATESFIGGRQAATVLTKATWATGAIFLFLSVWLAVLSSQRRDPMPLLQDEFRRDGVPTAPQPIVPGGGEAAPPGEVIPGVPEGGGGASPDR